MANRFGELLSGSLPPMDVGGPTGIPQGVTAPKKPSKGSMILGIIADALAGARGQAGPYAAMLGKEREAEAERVNWGLKREADLADYGRKLEMQNDPRYAKPPAPYRTTDNAGNVHEQQPDGSFKPIFIDPNDKSFVHDGMQVNVPNALRPVLGAPAGPPVAPVGNLKPFGGPVPQAPGTFRRPY